VRSVFADALHRPVATIILTPEKEGGKSEEVAAVYTIDHSTLLVVGLKAIPASRSFALARTLFEHLPPAEETLVLHSLGRHEYLAFSQPETSTSSTFRLLETQAYQRKRHSRQSQPACPFLEVPNMIEGAAAAIFSHLERRRQAGQLVVSIRGEEPGGRLGVEAVRGFETVLASNLIALTEDRQKQAAKSYYASVKAFNASLSLAKASIFL